jgi:hypothetical protein
LFGYAHKKKTKNPDQFLAVTGMAKLETLNWNETRQTLLLLEMWRRYGNPGSLLLELPQSQLVLFADYAHPSLDM